MTTSVLSSTQRIIATIALFITSSTASIAASPIVENTFSITGKITNLTNNSKVELFDIGTGASVKIASTIVTNSSFQLSGICNKTTMTKLTIAGVSQSIYFVLSHGNSILSGNIDNIKYEGNQDIKDFASAKNILDNAAEQIDILEAKADSLKSTDEILANDKKIVTTYLTFSKNMVDFIKTHPDSYASNYLLLVGHKMIKNNKTSLAAYNALSEANKLSYYAKAIKTALDEERTAEGIGTFAKDFTMNDIEGKPIKLSSFKGKYVLVDFWASWCGPCRRENPNVARAYRLFNKKNFTVLGVSLDEDRDDWKEAITSDKLTWTHVSDLKGWENAVAVQYGVKSIPQNILIDPNGKIVAKNLRGFNLLQFLTTTLGE